MAEPVQCRYCQNKHVMRLLPNRSQYINRQIVKMQVGGRADRCFYHNCKPNLRLISTLACTRRP